MVYPVNAHLKLWRNADTVEEWTFRESGSLIDFTGYTGKLELRRYPGAPGSPLITLNTISADGEGLRLDLGAGAIRLWIAAESVRALPAATTRGGVARFSYDLLLTSPAGLRELWAQGFAFVETAVTIGG